ncbi:MAG: enediyne biosynthesis protein [Pseudonocardiales bacterium]|jgi:hypothetical protein|nr:enediyne biosynthesis protein [Pseudonocardiales bacterium]
MQRTRFRRLVPALCALGLAGTLLVVGQLPVRTASAAQVASPYRFQQLPIALPPGYDAVPTRTERAVNPDYQHIRAWLSAVGSSIAMNDLVGHGRSDALCFTDTRTNEAVVTYTPTAPPADRFTPFLLRPNGLPMDENMAPMGCVPGDYNGDGRMDLLVYYWGRTPIVFLAKESRQPLSLASYLPQELVPTANVDGQYHGARWNTNAVGIADLDGDGHPDIVVGNYFPDVAILDTQSSGEFVMDNTLSHATNGGGDRVLRWTANGGTSSTPSVRYLEQPGAIPLTVASGWTLAITSADLTDDGKPEVYVANDFGRDHLLYNLSTPGKIRFRAVVGSRTPTTPKSFVIGHDSFKGMGADFTDLDNQGRFDLLVSNITATWGLQESNFAWHNDADTAAEMRRAMESGQAPFSQRAQQDGLAWTGWSWDVKAADLLNQGHQDVLQSDGFVRGTIDRWNWLQELAISNDDLIANPAMWPHFKPGDDVSGHDAFALYARSSTSAKFVNISEQVGTTADRIPSRGVAIGDSTGTGTLDFAVARQWALPVFYRNTSPRLGNYLNLQLYRPATTEEPVAGADGGSSAATGLSPAYGAVARVVTSAGPQLQQLDGGGGHGGKVSFDVHFGLGDASGPVTVDLSWRDQSGAWHSQRTQLAPGSHALLLGSSIKEITRS